MIKFTLSIALFLFFAVPAIAARQAETITFSGGELLLLDNNGFVWESQDASGILPNNVRRGVEAKLETVLNGPPNIRALLSVYTNDGHYELIPLSPGAMQALADGLKHAGIVAAQ